MAKHRHIIDYVALANALVSGVSLIPQAWKVLKTLSVHDLSFATFTLILLNSVIWSAYAVHRRDLILLVSSALSIGTAFLILALMLVLPV